MFFTLREALITLWPIASAGHDLQTCVLYLLSMVPMCLSKRSGFEWFVISTVIVPKSCSKSSLMSSETMSLKRVNRGSVIQLKASNRIVLKSKTLVEVCSERTARNGFEESDPHIVFVSSLCLWTFRLCLRKKTMKSSKRGCSLVFKCCMSPSSVIKFDEQCGHPIWSSSVPTLDLRNVSNHWMPWSSISRSFLI